MENIITDLHTLYQPPECLAPLQVDEDKAGKDSDHNVVLLPPIMISNNRKLTKRSVVTRPLPESGVGQFTEFICAHTWEEVLGEDNIDKKVNNFHNTLRMKLDEYLPEKMVRVSYLDNKWSRRSREDSIRNGKA